MKTFFSSMSVGSSSTSRPSTRESQNAAAVESQEVVQDEESAQIQSVVAEIDGGAAVEQQPEVEQQPVGEGHNGDGDGGINLIREFDPNVHVISDLALRIPFEQFHPNIIDEVKRAYLLKGPTQPKDPNIIKTNLRNRMADEWLNDLLLCYIEKEIFRSIDAKEIKNTFQATKNQRIDLPRPPRRPRHD